MTIHTEIVSEFESHYNTQPRYVVRAPGRVNLIGEHTDYNDGFVLPMTIEQSVWIALRPRQDRHIHLFSMDYTSTTIEFSLENIMVGEPGPAEYTKGIAWALQSSGLELTGWEGVMKGDVPIGAGLSSSAALEMATAQAFCAVSQIAWYAPAMAKLGQLAENKWVGVNSGIMDQMISASGRPNQALLIDCRSLNTEYAPIPKSSSIVVLDTGTRRRLVGSAYNERRNQCEAAANFFHVDALRDITIEQFEKQSSELDTLIRKRARHVITENQRTLQAKEAMLQNDAVQLGILMNASHQSLRDDFEVSSDKLNAIVKCARQHHACYGARMTGAGFGGCAVALVSEDCIDDFVATTAQCYKDNTSDTPQIYVTKASSGAEIFAEFHTDKLPNDSHEINSLQL